MKIEVTFIPSEYKLNYKYGSVSPNGKVTRGLQLDPFKELTK